MRILLIAYEFPPSPSPQSLRWTYLCRELARMGHEVHVLTAELGWETAGLPELPGQVRVHRVFGGPITGVVAMLARRHAGKVAKAARNRPAAMDIVVGMAVPPVDGAVVKPVMALRESRLNWKGRLVEKLRKIATQAIFPDARGEWYFPARRASMSLLGDIRPDIIVSSHEPATTLELAINLKRRYRDIPWIADLGDPVLADYTPRRWRRRALRLERRVMELADGVTVTAPGTRDLLLERHGAAGLAPNRVQILTQGFEDDAPPPISSAAGFFDTLRLELLYTGSFYQFRRPDVLLDAVAQTPGVRLNIASSNIPEWLRPRLEAQPERFRMLGFLPHRNAVALQRQADVLVNIANDNPCQVPGKIYEYLGSGRPIIHVGNVVESDVSAALIRGRRRGWVCGNDREAMAGLLEALAERKRAGRLDSIDLDLDDRVVAEFGWSQVARHMAAMMERLVATGERAPPEQGQGC
ncbi:glycosyltransferase [Stenotrophomonas daejeonensis]|nr:glycosyltransferase [Stenotrophomonas daejeonensis]